jgi:hypothetical protein
VVVVAVVLLLAAEVVRNSAVSALAAVRPQTAARLWPGHPAVRISLAMADIGASARERRPIDERSFAAMAQAAAEAPLSPEPFLVRGVRSQLSDDLDGALRAFLAAQWRDPRSLPAAYFLANHYLRHGDSYRGLQQTSLLARLSPGGTAAAAPFVAAYARDRSNWPMIRSLFRSQPELEDGVLNALARNPGNADAILAISGPAHRRPDSAWLATLLNSLVTAGQYSRARAIWSAIAGARTGSALVYDADFTAPQAPPPFNWSLAGSTIGLAERQPGGGLHLIFYGNRDGVLASELVMLAPGTYRLDLQLVGAAVRPELLRWSIRCDRSSEPISTAALDTVARRGWTFAIPANCPAQWLELSGRSGDIAQQSDATFARLRLKRAGADA